jgi:hypothetical protein
LGDLERTRLAELEQVVDRGLQTFLEVGQALREIRDSRLYREDYSTFEAYLDERWGMSRSRGYRLIDAAAVAELVSPMGDIPNERQARELVPLLDQPDDLVAVVRELRAEYGDRITAEKTRIAVGEHLRREQQLGTVFSSDTFEWYTPPIYVNAARDVLGAIDLDPASSAEANGTVNAAAYYDVHADGLSQPWHGRVWMNPPYGGQAGLFVDKLLADYAAGRVVAAVLLLNGYRCDAVWFQPLWEHVLCFTDHRIRFTSPFRDSSPNGTSGSVFVYVGPDRARFVRTFSKFGHVVAKVAA